MFDMLFGRSAKSQMVSAEAALPGRPERTYSIPEKHAVLGTPMLGPWPGAEVLYVAMGCFWGAEKRMWRLDGVVCTAAGYQGGMTPNPSYEETCTGRTGHTEAVLVAYNPAKISTLDVLRCFWENHDPTQVYRQGNDIGTQYRSAVYWTNPEQERWVEATRTAYDDVLRGRGFDPISTELASAEGRQFYYAEAYHQQYLYKNPNGYDCHSLTGIDLPDVKLPAR